MVKPVNISQDQVIEAIQRREYSLDNPGFCLACGEEATNCEPDARNYKCEFCGSYEVYGAEEILLNGYVNLK